MHLLHHQYVTHIQKHHYQALVPIGKYAKLLDSLFYNTSSRIRPASYFCDVPAVLELESISKFEQKISCVFPRYW